MSSVNIPLPSAQAPLSEAEARNHVYEIILELFRVSGDEKATLTYSKIDKAINDDVRGSFRSMLTKARQEVTKNYGHVFTCKTNVGFIPLSNKDKLTKLGGKSRKKIKAETARWRTSHQSINPHELSQVELVDYTKECLRLNLQDDINNGDREIEVAAAIEAATEKRPMESTSISRILKAAAKELHNL